MPRTPSLREIMNPLDKPNRRTVEEFFRMENHHKAYYDDDEYKSLEREEEELVKKLTNTPRMREIRRRKKAVKTYFNRQRDIREQAIRKVRRLYHIHGLNARVIKELEKLVEFLNKLSD